MSGCLRRSRERSACRGCTPLIVNVAADDAATSPVRGTAAPGPPHSICFGDGHTTEPLRSSAVVGLEMWRIMSPQGERARGPP